MAEIFFKTQEDISISNFEFVPIKHSVNLLNNTQLRTKRIMDIFLSGIFLILIGFWLFPLIALIIRLDSKGPIFFKQLRHGQNNVPFECIKFRSMKYNPTGHFKQASKGDSRITKVGIILRKTSLDELPQLINVFKGEMSLVGPRPHAIVMNKEYAERIEHFMFRHTVKPGITGLAQAKGFRGEINTFRDMNARLQYDFFYIKKWSLLMDFKILLWTIHCLIYKNDNAY